MPCKRADLTTGAYLSSPLGLFGVQAIRPGPGGVSEAVLTDESEPLTTERLPDPQVPGKLGRSLPLEPAGRVVPLHRVLCDFDLVRHAPNADDTASAEEWGRAG